MIRIFSLADIKYLKYIKSLIRSSLFYYPEIKLNIYLVNVDEIYIYKLKNNDCEFNFENITFENNYKKRLYCATKRGELFVKLRKKYPNDYLIWIDADSVFIKRSEYFIKHIVSCDVSMRPKNLDKGKFASGVIISGPNSINFFECYKKEIYKRYNLYKWTTDQDSLNLTYSKFKDKLNFIPLPKIFCDVWFSNNGVLWVAKGKSRDNKLFKKEISKWI